LKLILERIFLLRVYVKYLPLTFIFVRVQLCYRSNSFPFDWQHCEPTRDLNSTDWVQLHLLLHFGLLVLNCPLSCGNIPC